MDLSPATDATGSRVISQYNALVRLGKIGELCRKILSTRGDALGVDGWSGRPTRTAPLELATDFINTSCTWKHVFGTPVGVLPPPKGEEAKHARSYDYHVTKILPKTMRKKWIAKFVQGDGNCSWRSLTMALMGSDEYWVQVKLVVLAWSIANSELLLAAGGILYDNDKMYPHEIHRTYGQFNETGDAVSTSVNSFYMLIASAERFSPPTAWGTDLTMLMASQALRIMVKVLHPKDKQSRVQYDSQGRNPLHGTGRKGDRVEDDRFSQVFVPDYAALVTELKRSADFKGQSIHPRWHSSVEPWSIANVGLGTFDGDRDESYDGGFTGDWDQSGDFGDLQGENTPESVLSVVRGRAYANLTEMCNRAIRAYTDSMTRDSTIADQSMFGDLMRHVDDFVRKRRSGETEQSSFQVKDPPVTRNRKQSRTKDCTERGGKAKNVKTKPTEGKVG